MVEAPETVYAKSGDVFIAYQCLGAGGPIDYVCLPPLISNIDLIWECPQAVRFMRRLPGSGGTCISISVGKECLTATAGHRRSTSASTTSSQSWMPRASKRQRSRHP